MDSTKMLNKIAEISKENRRVDSIVNSLKEDFYFATVDRRYANKLFHPILAGVTHPSPDYYCERFKTDMMLPYQYVLEYVVSGTGYLDVSGKHYEVHAGDTYLVNRAVMPARWYSDCSDPYEKKWLNFCGRFAEGLAYAYNMTEPVYIAHLNTEDQMDEIHSVLLDYNFRDSRSDDFRIMKQLLKIYERMHLALEEKGKPDRATFHQIAEYISANLLYESLTPKRICMNFYISDRTLIRMFVNQIGISPAKYITLQRVEYAKQLLLTTNCSIEEISKMLHFSDARYFRYVFSKYCGMTPTEWRKKKNGG